MSTRYAILPHGASDSAMRLRAALYEAAGVNDTVHLCRSTGSRFPMHIARDTVLFNYGSRSSQTLVFQQTAERVERYKFLNKVAAVGRAANKVEAFTHLRSGEVPTVEWTQDIETARQWCSEGGVVYARTVLNGHSGEGIVICDGDTVSLPDAPLYTKGITEQRREFRIHVFQGRIIHVQQKKRRDGWQELPEYSERIRNHHTGWIYATSDINPNNASINAALQAVTALGLDFGAVDVITRRDNAWVLEVNTAPGMEGTTLNKYVAAIIAVGTGSPITEWTVGEPTPEVVPEPTPVNEPEITTPVNVTIEETEMPTQAVPALAIGDSIMRSNNGEVGVITHFSPSGRSIRVEFRDPISRTIVVRNFQVSNLGQTYTKVSNLSRATEPTPVRLEDFAPVAPVAPRNSRNPRIYYPEAVRSEDGNTSIYPGLIVVHGAFGIGVVERIVASDDTTNSNFPYMQVRFGSGTPLQNIRVSRVPRICHSATAAELQNAPDFTLEHARNILAASGHPLGSPTLAQMANTVLEVERNVPSMAQMAEPRSGRPSPMAQAEVRVAAEQAARAAAPVYVDDAYYIISFNGSREVAQYVSGAFLMCGVEIALELNEVSVIRQVELN